MRVDALDDFAVEFENQPQDAMRGGMLRAEIDREIAKVLFVHRVTRSQPQIHALCFYFGA